MAIDAQVINAQKVYDTQWNLRKVLLETGATEAVIASEFENDLNGEFSSQKFSNQSIFYMKLSIYSFFHNNDHNEHRISLEKGVFNYWAYKFEMSN